jgi:hypothetical protein
MGKTILLVLAVASAGAVIPGAAAADGLPYCIKGCDFGGGTGDCSFLFLTTVPGDGVRP